MSTIDPGTALILGLIIGACTGFVFGATVGYATKRREENR